MSISALSRASLRPKSKLSNAFLQLPPSYRAFHASPRPRFLETIIAPTYSLFEGVHSLTGLQWAYTIPLTALVIRTFFTLPISIYTRRVQQKQAALLPVINAWTNTLSKEAMQQSGHLGPVAAQTAVLKKLRKKRKEILQRGGVSNWKNFLPFLHLPILLTAIETLRMMSGADVGLLGHLASGFSSAYSVPFISPTSSLTAWFEPSLANEGMLWFKDLTVADPEGRLSYILSGALLINIWDFGKKAAREPSVWQKRLQRALIAMACVAGPALSPLPSGILIYWISSVTFAFVQSSVLARVMVLKIISACKPKKFEGIGSSMKNRLK